MSAPITVTTAVKFRRWLAPNFATQDMPPRPKQDGMVALPTAHVRDLPHQVLDALAEAWLVDLYEKAGQSNPFTNARAAQAEKQ